MKNLIKLAVVMVAISVSAQALNRENSYKLINACQYEIDVKKGKSDPIYNGYISGLSRAYRFMLYRSKIDNEFAALDGMQFSKVMCSKALYVRKKENEETGGKYDVTKFQSLLEAMGYIMATYIPKKSD